MIYRFSRYTTGVRMSLLAAELSRVGGVDCSPQHSLDRQGRSKGARRAQGRLRWQISLARYEELMKQPDENHKF